MNCVVLDASMVVALLVHRTDTPLAVAVMAELGARRWWTLAPSVLRSEVLHVIRRRMRRDGLVLPLARERLDDVLALAAELVDDPDPYRRAVKFTEIYRYSPTGYDALCAALAEDRACHLWVADERSMRAVGDRPPYVKSIGEYRDAPRVWPVPEPPATVGLADLREAGRGGRTASRQSMADILKARSLALVDHSGRGEPMTQ